MTKEDFEIAKALDEEIASNLLEQEALRGIIERIDNGMGVLNFEYLNVPLDEELRAKIRDHYQKKLAASIAKADRLKIQFEGL